MVERITCIESKETNPYRNLAVEEQLLLRCREDECIMYLWQNRNTVVIGRNQNAWKECRVSKLQEEKGFLARRLSGGGAVYHDLGNLNFTFFAHKDNYDVERQLTVIIKALQNRGVHAYKSGRNDILIEEHKFSGNAFYEQGNRCYHHGTLMVDVNIAELSRYLTVSKDKLKSKGVDSVRSRVVNLTEYDPTLTIEVLKEKLKEAFEEVYGLTSDTIKTEELDAKELEDSIKRLSSWDWIFGKSLDFQHELYNRFPWGQVTLQVKVQSGKIEDLVVFSDSMKPEFILQLKKYLKNVKYDNHVICTELSRCWSDDPEEEQMMNDIIEWLQSTEL